MSTAAIVAGTAAAGIAGSAISANAAGNAADAQVGAANAAANLQHQDAQAALAFNQHQFQTQQNNLAPWLQAGRGALVNLSSLMGTLPAGMTIPGTGTPGTAGTPGFWTGGEGSMPAPDAGNGGGDYPIGFTADGQTFGGGGGLGKGNGGEFIPGTPGTPGTPDTPASSLVNPALGAPGSLAQGWTGHFEAPTNVTEQNDPGYQFRLQQGRDLLEHGAAARGDLLNGATAKAEQEYGQNYASNEYDKVYNRAFNQYATNYNQFQQHNTDLYNRLANQAGMGQTTAQQLGMLGSQAAGNNTNILLGSGAQIGQDLNNAGAARASGYVGAGNAWNSGLGGINNNLMSMYMLNQLTPGTTAPRSSGGMGVI